MLSVEAQSRQSLLLRTDATQAPALSTMAIATVSVPAWFRILRRRFLGSKKQNEEVRGNTRALYKKNTAIVIPVS